MAEAEPEFPFPWHLGVYDAHCHPTDTLEELATVPSMHAKVLTVMATRAQDQDLVAKAAEDFGVNEEDLRSESLDWSKEHKIIPAFGWHPWFSYQMFDEDDWDGATSLTDDQKVEHLQKVLTPRSDDRKFLLRMPDSRPLNQFIKQTRDYLTKYPLALIGEVGVDKSFRIPVAFEPQQESNRDESLTPGGREGRKLSSSRVCMDHQKKVLLAQLHLAGDMQRAVSVHGVAAHGILHDTLAETWKGQERTPISQREKKRMDAARKIGAEPVDAADDEDKPGPKPYPPRICLHSFSGNSETVKQYTAPSVPCDVFFSFSTTINCWDEGGNGKVEAAVKAVPDDRVLIESDLHTAGDRMDHYLEHAVRKVCEVKGWELEDGVRRLGRNWRHFVLGER